MRRNPDEDLRQLLHAAAGGDVNAAHRFRFLVKRILQDLDLETAIGLYRESRRVRESRPAMDQAAGQLARANIDLIGRIHDLGGTEENYTSWLGKSNPRRNPSASRDARFRAEAVRAWETLQDWVKASWHELPSIATRSERFGGWGISWREIAGREEYSGLLIILGADGTRAGFGQTNGTVKLPVIVLPVLLRPFDVTYLNTRITGKRESFVHEFIHYLDSFRMGHTTTAKLVAPAEGLTDDNTDKFIAYFLLPPERNAYFQEGAHKFERAIELRLRTDLPEKARRFGEELFASRPEEILRQAKRWWEPAYIEALKTDPRAWRQFVKRLSGFLEHLRKTG